MHFALDVGEKATHEQSGVRMRALARAPEAGRLPLQKGWQLRRLWSLGCPALLRNSAWLLHACRVFFLGATSLWR